MGRRNETIFSYLSAHEGSKEGDGGILSLRVIKAISVWIRLSQR